MNLNKKLFFHECEIKFVLDQMDEKKIVDSLMMKGFYIKEDILETDYTPDVIGFACKKNKLVLRIRFTTGTKNDCLITLKVKQKNDDIQDNLELEFYCSDFSTEKFNEMNNILRRETKHTIPEKIIGVSNINEAIEILKEAGFVENRMLSQKKRVVFSNDVVNVSFDTFPKNIGRYMEVETWSPEILEKFVKQMQFDKSQIETRNYGKIIQEKQSELSERERRICLF